MSDKPRENPSEDASEGAIRTSFSLDRYARERIRQTAQTYGVSQAEIVNRSARLFEFLAERSLQRRAKNLAMLRTLAEQVERSLAAMENLAPHLRGSFRMAETYMWGAVEGEADSIKKGMVYGAEGFDLAGDMDLTDENLMEKVLANELPELGPHRSTFKDPGTARPEDISVSYNPYGHLSSGRIEKHPAADLDLEQLFAGL
jgi:hypothetical protein